VLTRELGVFTAYFATRPTTEPTKLLTTLEGPAIVLTEAERRKSVISRIYISRHTDPEVIRQLETARTKGIPVIETSVAELTLMASCRPHGGVVAMLGGRPKERSLIERALWFLTRLAIHESVQSPARR
jgi:tRNA G18 (ribose-2'-O)-methylase SpoU